MKNSKTGRIIQKLSIQRLSLIALISVGLLTIQFTRCVKGESESYLAPDPGEQTPIFEKVQRYHALLEKRRDEGKNVTRAVTLNEQSKQWAQAGDVPYAKELLDRAILELDTLETATGEIAVEEMKTGDASAVSPPHPAKNHIAARSVRLAVDASKMVITQAVPAEESGDRIDDYTTAFDTEQVEATGGVITVTVWSSPVFIEPADATGKVNESAMDSLFGVHPAHTYDIKMNRQKLVPPSQAGYDFTAAKEIGVRWNRPEYYALWGLIQPGDEELEKGRYDWKQSDYVYNSAPKEIEIFANIGAARKRMKRGAPPNPRTHTFKSPYYEEKYQAFVRALVERYDGDGIDDMPGLKKPVRFWQVDNEPDLATRDWEGYANLMKITYTAVKASCSDCQVAMGGLAMGKPGFEKFYAPVLERLGGRYVDIFDFHFFGGAGKWQTIQKLYHLVRTGLDQRGYTDTDIWLTETGTWTEKPKGGLPGGEQGPSFPEQSERDQAEELVKRYVYAASLGVKKVFWAFGMIEGFQGRGGWFDHMGLIYSGSRRGVKKLAYHAYRKMTEKLAGADLNSVKTLDLGERVAAFRFTKKGSPLYVVWGY